MDDNKAIFQLTDFFAILFLHCEISQNMSSKQFVKHKTQTNMKKKALIFIGLCTLALCTWQAQAVNTEPLSINIGEIADPPQGFEKIILFGNLLLNVGPNAIVAGASEDAIYIGFNQSFGNVSISIYNSMGSIVYSTVVNTDVQQVFIIPFTNAASGNYVVELSNANGYAEGDFEHN